MEKGSSRAGGVLVVEDDVLIAQWIGEELTALGFEEVFLAHDLATGLEYARTRPLLLAILDVNLGQELVYPVASALYSRGIPFFFSTALSGKDLPPQWSSHTVLSKPVDGRILAQAISRLQ